MRGSSFGMDANLEPLGYVQLSVGVNTSLGIIPQNKYDKKAIYALIVPEGDVRYVDNGEAVTASFGMLLPDGTPLWYTGPLDAIRFTAVNSAIINVLFYR